MINRDFLTKGLSLLKPLHEEIISGCRTVTVSREDGKITIKESRDFRQQTFGEGDRLILDFGNHYVGYFSLKLNYTGSHPDAPVLLKFRFAENAAELFEDRENYHGWICSSWVQEEQTHVDILPTNLKLPRRYAFRYVQIEAAAISSKFRLCIEDARIRSVTGADDAALAPYEGPEELRRLDAIGCRTLRNCMQTVFEDGPKRDRRLWIGDLRIQAQANYETFKDYDLVKACLYLFAALPQKDGRLSACLFLEPEPEADDTVMFDYSLLYINTLLDYYRATGDLCTLRVLSETAYRQIDLAAETLGADGIVSDSDRLGWCFTDWNLHLNKQAAAHGVLLYALQAAIEIAAELNDTQKKQTLQKLYDRCKAAANHVLWDPEKSFYISGKDRQISWASQIWMILGKACSEEQAADLLSRLPDTGAEGMVTPYMYHHYILALLSVGQQQKALDVLRSYWGGMADLGADTFWELYNPLNPAESPYGGAIVNSYCHAWSCAPAWFLRKYYS